ncbi:MAG: amidase domain-containing protein [Clostridia bacterium]|nr:amidase domain-containing protein [Clostridia bacterium]
MLNEKEYDRIAAVMYARKWALSRNPLFADYAGIGGDCTSFASQCVLAGSCAMNFTPTFGWYYITPELRTASWTGVEFFYDFMINNRSVGPIALPAPISSAEPGDVIQLAREGDWYHTLVVTRVEGDEILVAAHTIDALDKPLTEYQYDEARLIHFIAVKYSESPECFLPLLNGTELRL